MVEITKCPTMVAKGAYPDYARPWETREHHIKEVRKKHERERKKRRRAERKERAEKRQEDKAFYESYEWRKVRYMALKACGGRCLACGRSAKDGVVIHVDHIKPRRFFPDLALKLSNTQVLCEICNHGKGCWDHTDWREPDLATLMGERIG